MNHHKSVQPPEKPSNEAASVAASADVKTDNCSVVQVGPYIHICSNGSSKPSDTTTSSITKESLNTFIRMKSLNHFQVSSALGLKQNSPTKTCQQSTCDVPNEIVDSSKQNCPPITAPTLQQHLLSPIIPKIVSK